MNEEGYPLREEASTSYVGAIESCQEFGHRLYAEAWRRVGHVRKHGWYQGRSGMDLESGGSAFP